MVKFKIFPLEFSREYDSSTIEELRRKIAEDFKVPPQNIVIWDDNGNKSQDAQKCSPDREYHGGILPLKCHEEEHQSPGHSST